MQCATRDLSKTRPSLFRVGVPFIEPGGAFGERWTCQLIPPGLLASLVEWFIKLNVLVVAFDALGLPAVSSPTQG